MYVVLTASARALILSYPGISRKLRYRGLHILVLHHPDRLIRAAEDQATIHHHAGRPEGHILVPAEGFKC